jgi:hypothetical protein
MCGAAIRSDSARHYIADLHAAGLIELIKREIVLETTRSTDRHDNWDHCDRRRPVRGPMLGQ